MLHSLSVLNYYWVANLVRARYPIIAPNIENNEAKKKKERKEKEKTIKIKMKDAQTSLGFWDTTRPSDSRQRKRKPAE